MSLTPQNNFSLLGNNTYLQPRNNNITAWIKSINTPFVMYLVTYGTSCVRPSRPKQSGYPLVYVVQSTYSTARNGWRLHWISCFSAEVEGLLGFKRTEMAWLEPTAPAYSYHANRFQHIFYQLSAITLHKTQTIFRSSEENVCFWIFI